MEQIICFLNDKCIFQSEVSIRRSKVYRKYCKYLEYIQTAQTAQTEANTVNPVEENIEFSADTAATMLELDALIASLGTPVPEPAEPTELSFSDLLNELTASHPPPVPREPIEIISRREFYRIMRSYMANYNFREETRSDHKKIYVGITLHDTRKRKSDDDIQDATTPSPLKRSRDDIITSMDTQSTQSTEIVTIKIHPLAFIDRTTMPTLEKYPFTEHDYGTYQSWNASEDERLEDMERNLVGSPESMSRLRDLRRELAQELHEVSRQRTRMSSPRFPFRNVRTFETVPLLSGNFSMDEIPIFAPTVPSVPHPFPPAVPEDEDDDEDEDEEEDDGIAPSEPEDSDDEDEDEEDNVRINVRVNENTANMTPVLPPVVPVIPPIPTITTTEIPYQLLRDHDSDEEDVDGESITRPHSA